MITRICFLLLVSTIINAQDKGQFENYSNIFYGKIVDESNKYEAVEKKENKSLNIESKRTDKKLN